MEDGKLRRARRVLLAGYPGDRLDNCVLVGGQ